MSLKTKNQKYVTIALIAILALGVASYMVSQNPWIWTPDPSPTATPKPSSFPSSTPTATPIGQTPSPTPIGQTPTPTPTTVPTATPRPPSSATVWQALFVTNNDGTNYWLEPSNHMQASTIIGADKNGVLDVVSSVQNSLNINVNTNGRYVLNWNVTAYETITVKDSNHNVIGTVLPTTKISQTGLIVPNGENFAVMASTITTSHFETILRNAGVNTSFFQPTWNGYYSIVISGISIHMIFNDGTSGTLSTSGSNTLEWKIMVS